MSSGSLKGLEVILIAGVVFWFAYSQLTALKRTKPTDSTKPTADTTETPTTTEQTHKDQG
jgi:hypothetical protein